MLKLLNSIKIKWIVLLGKEYGRNVGAANDIDNYYHSLLQCNLARISKRSKRNGIILGHGKEIYDYYKKIHKGMPIIEVLKDNLKDLKNNEYGSNIGSSEKNISCEELLDDKRTKNMRRKNIR